MPSVAEVEQQVSGAEVEVRDTAKSLQDTVNKISVLENDSNNLIHNAAQSSYATLESVVQLLLKVEDGNTRLSRQDASIMRALDDAVNKFQGLDDIAHGKVTGFGVKAGDCKELEDKALTLARSLESRAGELNKNASSAWDSAQAAAKSRQDLIDSESSKRNILSSAQSKFDDADNWFTGMFTSASSVNAAREARDEAQRQLTWNLNEQQSAKTRMQDNFQIVGAAKTASAAHIYLLRKLQGTAADFGNQYVKVTTTQSAADKLWGGVKDLRYEIWNTDFQSTRDHSIHQILKLLTLDNEVFMLHPFFEETEARIKQAIQAKLGSEALQRLIDGKFEIEGGDKSLLNL